MKKLFLLAFSLLVLIECHSQELILNKETGYYQHTYVKDSTSVLSAKASFASRLVSPKYFDVIETKTNIAGKSFVIVPAGVSQMKINFTFSIDFKQGRHRVTFTNFQLTDGQARQDIEATSVAKKIWVNRLNDKLASIINDLEGLTTNQEW